MPIITKHKDTTGAAAASLDTGELGVNTVDGTLSVGSDTGNVDLVLPGTTTLPTGTEGQTLRNDSGTWESTSDLTVSSGGAVSTGGALDVAGNVASNRHSIPGNNSVLGRMDYTGYTVGTTEYIGARVVGKTSQAWNVSQGGTRLEFETTAGGGLTSAVTMTLSGSGDLDVTGDGTFTGVAQGSRVRASSNGSVALPSFSWGTDTDTGMYRDGSGVIGFSSNNSEVMTIGPTVDTANGELVGATEIGVPTQAKVNSMMSVTQAEYDAIVTPDANTLYIII